MNWKRSLFSAFVLMVGIAAFTAVNNAQGPLFDKVMVNLPYSVTIGERTLQPGDYVIQQLPSPGGASRVLLIYSDNGMKFETSAMTIPALDNNTPENTRVILHHFGPDYYFDKIWIQGKNYGYEFPLPDAVKARQRERMEPLTVAATYEAVPDESAQATTTQEQTTTTEQRTTTTQETERTEVAQAPAQPEPQPAAPEAPAAAQPEPAPAQAEPEPAPAVTAERDTSADRAMPDTAANWLGFLLSGGVLTGAGLALRRR